MIVRTYNFENEKQASQFDKLYFKIKEKKNLTVKDAVLGLVHHATDEELIAFFTEDDEDLKIISSDEVFKKYKS